ncbi:hypothetical protein ACEPUD_17090 [Burkholderia ubonensis]|uniref:hypothetical protein n=1 Tax=Burkholderia ubonensis TaxID=101571 RepID=UPI00358DFB1A
MSDYSLRAQIDAGFVRFFHDDAMSKPHTAPVSIKRAGPVRRALRGVFPHRQRA